MNELSTISVSDVERMAAAVAKSKLFGVTSPEQAMALMLVAQAEGLHPATAARDYHVINGRPALKADAMLARFLSAGGRVRWISMTDERVEAEFSHPAGGTVTIDWDAQRATRAGIKNDMHKKYPRQMLRARVISEGIRSVFPGVAVGVYTPEEVVEFDDGPRARRSEKPLPQGDVQVEREIPRERPAVLPLYPQEQLEKNLSVWEQAVRDGRMTPDRVLAKVKSAYAITPAQHEQIMALGAQSAVEEFDAEYAEGEVEHADA